MLDAGGSCPLEHTTDARAVIFVGNNELSQPTGDIYNDGFTNIDEETGGKGNSDPLTRPPPQG
jgi:hypothetical protein